MAQINITNLGSLPLSFDITVGGKTIRRNIPVTGTVDIGDEITIDELNTNEFFKQIVADGRIAVVSEIETSDTTATYDHYEGVATSPLTLAVSPTGVDQASNDRPLLLRPASYSNQPFLSLQEALNAVRRHRQFAIQNSDQNVTVQVAAGTYSGATLKGLNGGGSITIEGTWSAVTPTTGVQSGTAGAGTTPTALKKPTAAANWTASDLDGNFVRILSGGGAGGVRPIISTSTDTLTIHSLGGLDSTSVFEIVTPGTIIQGTTTLENWSPNLNMEACQFDGTALDISDCMQFSMSGCVIDSPADLIIRRCRLVNLSDCAFTDGSNVEIVRCNEVMCDRALAWDNGTVTISHALQATLEINAKSATTTPVSVKFCQHVRMGVDSSSNTGSGVLIESCKVESYGTGFVGTGNTGYGMDVQGLSWVDATGATITGTVDDFRCGEISDTWANLTTRESYVDKGTNIVIIT